MTRCHHGRPPTEQQQQQPPPAAPATREDTDEEMIDLEAEVAAHDEGEVFRHFPSAQARPQRNSRDFGCAN